MAEKGGIYGNCESDRIGKLGIRSLDKLLIVGELLIEFITAQTASLKYNSNFVIDLNYPSAEMISVRKLPSDFPKNEPICKNGMLKD